MSLKKTSTSAAASETPSEALPSVEAEILVEPDGSVCFISLFSGLLPVASALDPELALRFQNVMKNNPTS